MSMTPDQQKVILGLASCVETQENAEYECCENCPYQSVEHCLNSLLLDTLAILRKTEQTEYEEDCE